MTKADTVAPHLAETREAATKLHADHHERSTPVERLLDGVTSALGRPRTIAVIACFVLVWVFVNLALPGFGYPAFDPPPFQWLEIILTFLGFALGVLILSTQRRAGQLADLREQITLELASLTERKVGKVIELLEEMRRDSPELRNRIDHEANAMTERTDQTHIIDAVKDAHDKLHTQQLK